MTVALKLLMHESGYVPEQVVAAVGSSNSKELGGILVPLEKDSEANNLVYYRRRRTTVKAAHLAALHIINAKEGYKVCYVITARNILTAIEGKKDEDYFDVDYAGHTGGYALKRLARERAPHDNTMSCARAAIDLFDPITGRVEYQAVSEKLVLKLVEFVAPYLESVTLLDVRCGICEPLVAVLFITRSNQMDGGLNVVSTGQPVKELYYQQLASVAQTIAVNKGISYEAAKEVTALTASKNFPNVKTILGAVAESNKWGPKTPRERCTRDKCTLGDLFTAACYESGQTAYLVKDPENGILRLPRNEEEKSATVMVQDPSVFAIKCQTAYLVEDPENGILRRPLQ
ncbi:hypothetical protein M885DRAFT_500803 [Pelagophyceae sp. CCMP2097]|nr:hypothetical protein M885DRAFT_500803 [Pelagophyceae sp. CCMP2097]